MSNEENTDDKILKKLDKIKKKVQDNSEKLNKIMNCYKKCKGYETLARLDIFRKILNQLPKRDFSYLLYLTKILERNITMLSIQDIGYKCKR